MTIQSVETHQDRDLALLHALLGTYARQLWDVQKLRIMTTNRIAAMVRDEVAEEYRKPLEAEAENLQAIESGVERQLTRLGKQHPMADWIVAQPGIGLGGFARLLGITGPFFPVVYNEDGAVASGFPNVAKLWAYLGLHVVDGERPKRKRGEKANWAPQGQVLAHQLGDSIVKVGRGPWREAYDAKKAYYEAERPDWTQAHRHNAAMRYAVKELFKAMWAEWHQRQIGAPV